MFNSKKISKRVLLVLIPLFIILTMIYSAQIISLNEYGPIEEIKDIITNLGINSTYIFLDKLGIEGYGPFNYFISGSEIIYDRLPVMNNDVYAELIKKGDRIFVITSISPEKTFFILNQTLNEKNLVLNFTYKKKYIENGCDIRKYIINPGLGLDLSTIKKTCTFNNPPTRIINQEVNLFAYEIEFIPNKKLNLQEIKILLSEDLIAEAESYKINTSKS
ncbi:MAG: hypothetical protein V1824_02665 [archaeon]